MSSDYSGPDADAAQDDEWLAELGYPPVEAQEVISEAILLTEEAAPS